MTFYSCLFSGGWDIQHNHSYHLAEPHPNTSDFVFFRCFPAAAWIRNPQKSLTEWPLRSIAAHPLLDISTLTLQVSSWYPTGTEHVGVAHKDCDFKKAAASRSFQNSIYALHQCQGLGVRKLKWTHGLRSLPHQSLPEMATNVTSSAKEIIQKPV